MQQITDTTLLCNRIKVNLSFVLGKMLLLAVALLLLRFDGKLLCFDLKKAFLQIELSETIEQNVCMV